MAQFAPDGNPTIDGCRPAVLRVMVDGEERRLRDIITEVAEDLKLPPEVAEQRIRSGQTRVENRVGWACSSMYRAGLLRKPRYGVYRISENGKAVAARDLLEYTEADLDEWEEWRNYLAELAERKARSDRGDVVGSADPSLVADGGDPIEAILSAVTELNDIVETELRQTLQDASPEFFERAVLEVLWAMGYGGGQGAMRHLGQSNDGGIDGVIQQDPLGLQNVYVQAKRYRDGNKVAPHDVRDFYGALAGRNADRGVFMTTSSFSQSALDTAKDYRGRVILIDGIRLTSLMLRFGVGVEPREKLTVFKVNQDFFSDEVSG